MGYIIAAYAKEVIVEARTLLADIPDIDFRVGYGTDVAGGCDVQIIHYSIAHERYGGMPRQGQAQVLLNNRADGAPAIVVATPPIPRKDPEADVSNLELEEHAYLVLQMCIEALAENVGSGQSNLNILLHLDAAGMDRSATSSLKGIARFLRTASSSG